MKVKPTLYFDDSHRRLIARFLGKDGLASLVECEAWARQQVAIGLSRLDERGGGAAKTASDRRVPA